MSKCLLIALVSTFCIFIINSEVVKRSVCKENEVFVECAHCGPKTCDDLGFPSPCGGGTALCRPECVCIDGHVRDANDTCIPKMECIGCGGDSNATSGCGNHCGNSCSDYMESNKTCLSGCRYNRCDCRSGYVYNDAIGKCVLPADCCHGHYTQYKHHGGWVDSPGCSCGWVDYPACSCVSEVQSIQHIVQECPETRYTSGPLEDLISLNDEATKWLKSLKTLL